MDFSNRLGDWALLVLLLVSCCLAALLNNGVEASHNVFDHLQSVRTVNVRKVHRTAYHFQPTKHWINVNETINCWNWSTIKDDSPLLKRILAIRDKVILLEGSSYAAIERFSSWKEGNRLSSGKIYDYFRPKGTIVQWVKEVWNNFITPKHAFCLWLAIKGKLLTKDRLSFLSIDKHCVLCNRVDESATHLFFSCPFSMRVWECIRDWLGISRSMTTLASALKWIKKEARGTSTLSKAKRIALASTVYHIWNARNRMCFEDEVPNLVGYCVKIKSHVYSVIYTLYPNDFLF
ncbi:hypothetical protein CASFOL_027312 [Castilleja foliolosa]|uniref:Reverse transcriptase zinc-binding domain-containing protein n=1 Tax=Castilleja foliolosa TaxID=1961234 RepID=A0ABD3CEI1_9LAMI